MPGIAETDPKDVMEAEINCNCSKGHFRTKERNSTCATKRRNCCLRFIATEEFLNFSRPGSAAVAVAPLHINLTSPAPLRARCARLGPITIFLRTDEAVAEATKLTFTTGRPGATGGGHPSSLRVTRSLPTGPAIGPPDQLGRSRMRRREFVGRSWAGAAGDRLTAMARGTSFSNRTAYQPLGAVR
jgi:hypothetical protein